ncbi:MAG: twin-arginine translocation pathway signal protein [Burkholderiales bacterium RIFCSPLOWO2_12_FULL_61_40]|nr:MAG: twin-arginine translocation pathway signal protein [Burkholderiales bacterium RIFCSPLOWO2_12_FULL_61_40]
MPFLTNPSRRALLGASFSLAAATTLPAWAQMRALTSGSRQPTVLQIVDMSPSQIDVSKDFLVGSRAAWKDINAKGGVRGKAIHHEVLEWDGSAASLRAALGPLKKLPNCLALFGTAGDRAASQVVDFLRREVPDIAHVAPWLQNLDANNADNTFPIFASRQDQIAHAIKNLSTMGIPELGAVYGTAAEYAAYRDDMEQTAARLKIRLKSYSPTTDLQQLGRTLSADSPRVLIFIGGTPELLQFSQGIDKQAAQRYIIAMSDVNLQTLSQMGGSRYASVIATQVVPMVNSNLPIVKKYRETLGRLFDEPPTAHSLAGFVAARYTFDMLQSVDGPLTRQSTLQALQKRSSMDLGGFHIALEAKARSGTFVTQSMISAGGRLVG